MGKLSSIVFRILLLLLILFFYPTIFIGSFALSRLMNLRIIQLMKKYGREDVIKVLLMSGFSGFIRLLFSNPERSDRIKHNS
ncbi:MAG: hypothetical protein ACTSWR_04770 [Candidatus Helarchaeota archaeon]